jgi:hypothetical protein
MITSIIGSLIGDEFIDLTHNQREALDYATTGRSLSVSEWQRPEARLKAGADADVRREARTEAKQRFGHRTACLMRILSAYKTRSARVLSPK